MDDDRRTDRKVSPDAWTLLCWIVEDWGVRVPSGVRRELAELEGRGYLRQLAGRVLPTEAAIAYYTARWSAIYREEADRGGIARELI